MKTLMPVVFISCGLLAAVNPAFTQTWTQSSAPTNYWASIASSADGTRLAAVAYNGIYTSTNSGVDWMLTSTSQWWGPMASSADGNKLVASSTGIYTSTNAGATWTLTPAPSATWVSVASSADGTKLAAVADSPEGDAIYTSTNSGATWALSFAPPTVPLFSVASSADGTRLVVVGYPVYYSTNSGDSWTPTSTPFLPSPVVGPVQQVAVSADGRKSVAFMGYNDIYGNPSPLYTSTNFGETWTKTSAPSNQWMYVASSADGTRLIAVAGGLSQGGPIYTSMDSGVTWTSNNVPQTNWSAAAISADGCKMVAAGCGRGSGCPIFISYSARSPQLNLAPASTNLILSWLVPSTNFALQRSLDLATPGWTALTNTPMLNLTNLRDEVTLSATNPSAFYRLISQ
jgi:Tfp pilus assembly protein FimT